MGNPIEVLDFYSKKYVAPIMGSENFKARMLSEIDNKHRASCAPDIKRAVDIPTIEQIIENVAEFYKVPQDSLQITARGQLNWPRMLAMTISRQEYGYGLIEIAEYFQPLSRTAVSNAVQRCKKLLQKNKALENDMAMVKNNIIEANVA